MTDPASQETDAAGAKKERSPSFPFIGLTKAVERTQQLLASARRSEVRAGDAAAAWGWKAKSSGTLQTIAALTAYGLIESSGSGDARRLKVSDLGRKILEDQRPGVKEKALADAALKPKLFLEYALDWGSAKTRPADNIRLSELTLDRKFTRGAAETFLEVFDDTIQYASGASNDSVGDNKPKRHSDDADKATLEKPPQIGDYIQWTSDGLDVFPIPEKVAWVSEDGAWVRVGSSQTGIPAKEVQIMEAPADVLVAPPLPPPGGTPPPNDIKVLMDGRRLRINASVDAKGLRRLRKVLEAHAALMEDENED